MKFEDLKFSAHRGLGAYEKSAVQARKDFLNGWGVSVLSSDGSSFYVDNRDEYELAVMWKGSLHYSNPVAGGDVRGHLTKQEVEDLCTQVENYTERGDV